MTNHDPIAYTYEADHHCPHCTMLRFGVAPDGFIAGETDGKLPTDSEGNPVGAVFAWDEWQNVGEGSQTLNCGDCGTELDTYTEPITDNPRSLSSVETDQYRAGYITAMCWANAVGEADDGSDAEDYAAIQDSLTAEMLTELREQAEQFLTSELTDSEADSLGLDHGETVETVIAAMIDSRDYAYEPAQAGHDFALTRNGHGAGFWDRGHGLVGEILTAQSKPFGEAHVWVKDDKAVGVQN